MGDAVNLIAIETATSACAVGITTNDGRTLTRVVDGERRHTEVLAPALSQLFDDTGCRPRDVGLVVVDRGPGLFTGLRVGLATAIAFAQGVGAGIVGVTSLEALAHGAFMAGVRGRLVSCVDGRRGEIFVQTFELGDDVREVGAPAVAVARNVVIKWATDGVAVTFTGDGVDRYRTDFAAVPNGTIFEQLVPSVAAALTIATTREPVDVVIPLYLREADAVANFSTRERPQ